MKRILFDFFTPQLCRGGASEYIRKVYYALMDGVSSREDVQIYGLYKSLTASCHYPDLSPESVSKAGVTPLEVKGRSIDALVLEHQIDCVFIGAAQYWSMHIDVTDIPCRVVCVVHDIMDEEFASAHIKEYMLLDKPYRFIHFQLGELWRKWTRKKVGLERMKPFIELHNSHPDCQLVVVSSYTRTSMMYHFGIDEQRLHVFYSPQRVTKRTGHIDHPELRQLIESGRKYYLILNADRYAKNADKAIRAFRRFCQTEQGKDCYLVSLGTRQKAFEHHLQLPYLSENDLAVIMQHCYSLIFPSIFEGFGYPPLEAMSYGKPVLASNVTSMPEILGDAAIYFSPIYESDIYRALLCLDDQNYVEYARRSRLQYERISERQEKDLSALLNLLLQ